MGSSRGMQNDKRVLIVGPPLSGPGGVSGYYRSTLPFLEKEVNSGYAVRYVRVGERSGVVGRIKPISLLVDIWSVVRACAKFGPNLVHLNPSLSKKSLIRDSLLSFIVRLVFKARTLVFFRGWDKKNEGYFYRRLWFFKKTLLLADHYLTLSDHSKSQLAGWGVAKSKITVCFTVVDPGLQKFLSQKSIASNGPQVVDRILRVLFLGRMIRNKGIYELLEGFEQALKFTNNLELVLAGDGPEVRRLQSLVKSKGLASFVKFPGLVLHEEKYSLLASSQIFMLPSYTEGMPNAVLEAMAAGCLVYTTPVGGLSQFIEKGWVRPLRIGDASSICEALSDPLLLKDYLSKSAETSKLAIDNFNLRVICEGLFAAYEISSARAHVERRIR